MRRWSLILFGRTQSFGGGVLDQSSEAWNSFVIINFINIHTVTDGHENYQSTQHDIITAPVGSGHAKQSTVNQPVIIIRLEVVAPDVQSCRVRKKTPSVLWDRTEDSSVTKTKARQFRF